MDLQNLPAIDLNFWILQSLAMGATALLIPRLTITSIFGATLMVIALALINSYLWDAALFFRVPDALSTQTLLLFLVNGSIFWVLVKILPGIEVEGIIPALVAPVVFTGLSILIDYYGSQLDTVKILKQGFEQAVQLKNTLIDQGALPNPAVTVPAITP